MKDLQDTEIRRGKWDNLALFRDGALINAKATYADSTITLSKVDAAATPPMLAMVNGSFEPIPDAAATVPVTPVYTGWQSSICTGFSGRSHTTDGTLADSTLVDWKRMSRSGRVGSCPGTSENIVKYRVSMRAVKHRLTRADSLLPNAPLSGLSADRGFST